MQNRFGLKDFVFMLLVLAVGVLVVLNLVQSNREWERLLGIQAKQAEMEKLLASVSNQVDRLGREGLAGASKADLERLVAGIASRIDARSPAGGRSASELAPPPAADWAVAGVPVTSQPAFRLHRPPELEPAFRADGEFTELFEAQFPKVTPYISTDQYSRRIYELVAEPLADLDPLTLEYRGVLAEGWQTDPQGLWLRVKIRPEARFSDGEPVTAEDVRYTFMDFIMNPQMETARQRSALDKLKDVKVIRADVVEFQFTEAVFVNSDVLTNWILPKHFYSKFSPTQINQSTGLLMGSGPYRLNVLDPDNQWKPPEPLEIVRNERYWGPRSAIQKIRFRAIDNEQSRLVTYRNGEGDMVTPSAPQFKKLTEEPGWNDANHSLNWVNMKSGNSFIAWQCGPRGGSGKLTPFADRRVRRAMTHLLDRQKMIDTIWAGLGTVSKGVANPSSPAANPDQKPLPFDIDTARALLAEAGWRDRDGNGVLESEQGNEFVFELTYSGGGEIAERLAKFIQDSCARVGIRCQPKPIDWALMDSIAKSRDFDALTMAWGANAPESDPRQIWHSDSIKNQGDNFIQWSNPEADRLIDEGRKVMDKPARLKYWHQFESVVEADQPYTWIRIQPYLRFVKREIGNVRPYRKSLEPREYFRAAGPTEPVRGE